MIMDDYKKSLIKLIIYYDIKRGGYNNIEYDSSYNELINYLCWEYNRLF